MANGRAAAAIISAGLGNFLLGLLAFLSEASEGIKGFLTFHAPAGPLSGTSTLAVVGWLIAWVVLHLVWRDRDIRFRLVFLLALILIGLGMLLIFPPFVGVLFKPE